MKRIQLSVNCVYVKVNTKILSEYGNHIIINKLLGNDRRLTECHLLKQDTLIPYYDNLIFPIDIS